MQVRNKLFPITKWNGRWTDASDAECPCRSCYQPHDFGYSTRTEYKIRMLCLSRERGECPDVKPDPEHVYTKHGKVCKRCSFRKREKR
jgi:hypothetical protein